MAIQLKNKPVTTKKEHQCFACYRKFPAGTMMISWSSIYEGNFCNGYCCMTCEQIKGVWDHDGEGYPEGFVADGLNQGQTPEQYLIELTDYKQHQQELRKQTLERQKQRLCLTGSGGSLSQQLYT